jgi:O-antigen/teichoic acid export membrane protein
MSVTGGIQMRYLRTEAERVSRKVEQLELPFTSALAAQLALIAALALLGVAAAIVLGIRPGGANGAVFVLLSAAFAFSQAATQLVIYHHQAHLRFGKAGAVNIARAAVLIAGVLAVLAGLTRSGIAIAAVLTAVSLLVAAGASAKVIASHLRETEWRRIRINAEDGWLTGFYLASAGFATVDVFIVAILLTQADVAAFGAAQRYYAFALGAGPALLAVVRVRTSQSDVIDSAGVQMTMQRTWIRRASAPAIIATLLLAAAAPFILPLVNGGRYGAAIPAFQLLLIGVCAYYIFMPASSLLMAQGRYKALALAVIGAFIANALGDWLAAKSLDLGIVGIAAVASITYVAFFLATMTLARQVGPRTGKAPEDVLTQNMQLVDEARWKTPPASLTGSRSLETRTNI